MTVIPDVDVFDLAVKAIKDRRRVLRIGAETQVHCILG